MGHLCSHISLWWFILKGVFYSVTSHTSNNPFFITIDFDHLKISFPLSQRWKAALLGFALFRLGGHISNRNWDRFLEYSKFNSKVVNAMGRQAIALASETDDMVETFCRSLCDSLKVLFLCLPGKWEDSQYKPEIWLSVGGRGIGREQEVYPLLPLLI